MATESIIRKAEFNPNVCKYWLMNGVIVLLVTLIGIPLLLLWIPFGMIITRKYLSRMECVLTDKNLKVKKGIMVRTEKTIPLEKITDLGMVQGPIMRHFGIHQISVETAGQSTGGALVSLAGIIDVEAFREAVLSQRDALNDRPSTKSASSQPETPVTSDRPLLEQMNATLLRIEELLRKSHPGSN